MKLARLYLHITYLLLLFSLSFSTSIFAQDIMMQGWYWDYPKAGCNGYAGDNHAKTLQDQVADLGAAGINYLWIPPAARASFGECSNGYDPKDLYDLGEFGQGRTGFGTRAEVDALVSTANAAGVNIVADVVYNHRDGGDFESNPAVRDWIYNYTAGVGHSPFPSDRYRFVLPIGGNTGNGAGTYTIRIASHTGDAGFNHKPYVFFAQTNAKGFQDVPAKDENEPNGGGDCSPETGRVAQLGVDYNGFIETGSTCNTDEYLLKINTDDFNAAGDELTIFVRNLNGDYGDQKIYYLSRPDGTNVITDLQVHTGTDYTNLPSKIGGDYTTEMNFLNFKPNRTQSTSLAGDEDGMFFFYDYEQDYAGTNGGIGTRTALYDWTKWLWNEVGVRGYRMDAVKHFDRAFIGDLLDDLHDNSIQPGMVVGEFFDANPYTLKTWVTDVYAAMDEDTKSAIDVKVFDFSLREAIRKACDEFGQDVRVIYGASIAEQTGLAGRNSAVFVNNHDFRETFGGNQLIQNDPILGYAYILTNNQLGVPTIFYPDYYGYPDAPLDFDYHPTDRAPLKDKIDVLIDIHKKYIFGSTKVQYLNDPNNDLGGIYNYPDPDANDPTGPSTTLLYQLTGGTAGKEVLVAINFAGEELALTHHINATNISPQTTFTELTGNNNFPTINVNDNFSVSMTIPARSYVVYVQGEPLSDESTSTCQLDNTANFTYNNGWQNQTDAVTGFGKWDLRGTANSGFFLGTSTNNGGGDGNADNDINDTDGQAFGLFANSGQSADAFRSFTTPLTVGSVFTLQMDNGYINHNSSVGIGLQNAAGENLAEFFFKGGDTHYMTNDNFGIRSTGIPFSNEGLALSYTILPNHQYELQVTNLATQQTKVFQNRSLFSNPSDRTVARFRLFNYNAGNGSSRDVFFNHFNICRSVD